MQNLFLRVVSTLISLMGSLAPPAFTGVAYGQISASMVIQTQGVTRQRRRWFSLASTSQQTIAALVNSAWQILAIAFGQQINPTARSFAQTAQHFRIEEEGSSPRSEVTPRPVAGSVVSFIQHAGRRFASVNRIALFKASGFLA